jgi:hypothetical protein
VFGNNPELIVYIISQQNKKMKTFLFVRIHKNNMCLLAKAFIPVFKDIDGYDKYDVSNYGHVRNKKSGRILKPWTNHYGYHQVSLYQNGKEKKLRVNRLVLIAFVPNPDNKTDCDHIDRNRTNNCLYNLRWSTRSENMINTGDYKNNKSGHRHISWDKYNKKFMIRIKRNGKTKHHGYFKNIEDAIDHRDQLMKTIYSCSFSTS